MHQTRSGHVSRRAFIRGSALAGAGLVTDVSHAVADASSQPRVRGAGALPAITHRTIATNRITRHIAEAGHAFPVASAFRQESFV